MGGSAGGAKSMTACLWAVIECRNYPGIAIGIGRKELKRLKQTTMVTLMSKVHPLLGIHDSQFRMNSQEGYIQYINGSKIILVDMAYAPTDPDYDRFGSLELTHVIVEEAGEVMKKAVDVLSSRRNRMMNKEYGIIGKLLLTMNPSQNFLRNEYYKPYEDLGSGRMQKWQHGDVVLPDGERLSAFRVYLRSSVYDNPFIDANYVEMLKMLPNQERKRLLEGNWNYADEDDTLFKALLLDKATAYEKPEPTETFNKYIGVDVSDMGGDATIATLCVDGVIIEQRDLVVSMEGEKPISYLLADELIKFAQQNGFTANDAKNIGIEGNGVGVGMRDAMRVRGWYTTIFTATAQTRSESYYNFMLDMDAGTIKVLHGLDDGELRRQLAAHTYEFQDQKPRVVKKDKIKAAIGRSPDNADSANICNWLRGGGYGRTDPKKSQNRIRF